MSGELLILLELLLVFDCVIGFAVRELVLLRRHRNIVRAKQAPGRDEG